MYKRSEYLESTDCGKQSLARNNDGLDWNYAIARNIDRDLHEKLLAFDASILTGFVSVIPLISSGYFATAKIIISSATIDETLEDTRTWIVSALTEADEAAGNTAQTTETEE